MGTDLIPMNTSAVHYRQDVHEEWDLDYETAFPFTGEDAC